MQYRPEIDGLRAIAVVSVILYHAQISILGHQVFKGGFIGVDIFFVISGYLITSIILKELLTTGSFSFKNFYERRARRILPALLIVMLVSLPFAWMFFLPINLIDFSKSILFSLGFTSNFYFEYSGERYGAESGLLKPFLHTWSLSVEEQFYIFFPILLFFIFKYLKKFLIHILILGLLFSLGLADWGSKNYPSFNFYILPTRVWELLAGSILSYFEISRGLKSKHQTHNFILPTFGLFLIGYSFIFYNDEMFHPSFYTLSPIVGVCLIIWFSNKDNTVTKILSSKFFVGIGLISYSLYLWHYPFFAFDRMIEFTQGSLIKKFLLFIFIFLISILSYYFVEKPCRNRNYKFKIILIFILISITTLVTINFNIIFNNGYQNRVLEILKQNSYSGPDDILKNLQGKRCHGNINGCKFNTSSNKKVYLIGDSHFETLMHDLKDRVINRDYQFVTSTFAGCLFFPGFNYVYVKTKKISKECNNNYFEKLKQTLLNERNAIIIFGGRLPLYLSSYYFDNQEGGIEGKKWKKKFLPDNKGKYDTLHTSFKNEVLQLSKNNRIILVYPIPEVGWNVNNKIYNQWVKQGFPKNFYIDNITTSFQVYKDRTKPSFQLLDSIQSNNIYRVYPHTLFCNTTIKNRCVTHNKKYIFYKDKNHPSLKGAEMINDLIMKEIENIELSNK